jgi:hypothetical protein
MDSRFRGNDSEVSQRRSEASGSDRKTATAVKSGHNWKGNLW